MNHRGITRFLISAMLSLTSSAFAKTLYVGSCQPNGFPTISTAVAAAPAGSTIKVCPGSYPEQIVLTQAVTLEGISSNGADQAIVTSPPNGLVVNAWDDLGDPIAAQLLVDPISGFTISNLTFDASNSEVQPPAYVVGIFVQDSVGAINHVVTRNQIGNGLGVGVWLEGGSANPTVTLENSSVHDFDDIGIWTQTNAAASQLSAVVKNNFVNGGTSGATIGIIDIALNEGSTSTVSGNHLVGGQTGFFISGAANATLTGNNVTNSGTGAAIGGDGKGGGNISVESGAWGWAISVGVAVYSGAPVVQRNTIVGTPTGIDFSCNADANITGNTIIDATTGDGNFPVDTIPGDTFYNVQTTTGSSPAGGLSKRRR